MTYSLATLLRSLACVATAAACTSARVARDAFRAHVESVRAAADQHEKDAAVGRQIRAALAAAERDHGRLRESGAARRAASHRVYIGGGLGTQELILSRGATNVAKGGVV